MEQVARSPAHHGDQPRDARGQRRAFVQHGGNVGQRAEREDRQGTLLERIAQCLVPYDAARGVEITAADLDRLTAQGGAAAWVAQRARAWLDYWREDIGRQGFYPFDLLAAAYVLEPSWLRCTPVRAWVGDDRTMIVPWRPQALLIEPGAASPTLYCGRAGGGLKPGLMDRFTADGSGRTAAWSS